MAKIHHSTAYVCACGKKWVFLKREAAKPGVLRLPCRCGRTLLVGRGLIYAADAEIRQRR